MKIHYWSLVLAILVPMRAFSDENAQEHYKKGLGAYGLGHYGIAAVEYEKAFALEPQPALLFDAAQAHKLAGHNGRALALYQNYLRLYGDQIKNRKEVDDKIAELKAEIGAHPETANDASAAPNATAATTPAPVTSSDATASVALRALTPEWKAACPAHLQFEPTLTTKLPAGTALSYRMLRSDHSHGRTLTFALPSPGPVKLPLLQWQMGKSAQGWMQVEVLAPFTATSNQASFSVICPQ